MNAEVGNTVEASSKPLRTAAGLLVFALALAGASSLGFWLGRHRPGLGASAGSDRTTDATPAGDVASLASLRLPTLDGSKLGPMDFGARAVVLEFWATWCGPCAVQADILHTLFAEYGGKGVAFLAVNFAEPRDVVRSFVEKEPMPYPMVLDEDGGVAARAGISGLPTVVVLGGDGQVLLTSVGITGASKLRRTLDAALAG